jgi:TM2 domain-containing membrane protein YozV
MVKVCERCGEPLRSDDAEFCQSCGAAVPTSYLEKEKRPAIAVLLSIIFAGLGQVYNGQFRKGLLILLGSSIGFFIFVVPGLAVYGYGIYDAYVTARKMNSGEVPYREINRVHAGIFLLIWLAVLVVFFII